MISSSPLMWRLFRSLISRGMSGSSGGREVSLSGCFEGEPRFERFGDSTSWSFRIYCDHALREHGYEVKCWCCKGGGTEDEVDVHIATYSNADLCIAAPNGNRLSGRAVAREPRWFKAVAERDKKGERLRRRAECDRLAGAYRGECACSAAGLSQRNSKYVHPRSQVPQQQHRMHSPSLCRS